MPRKNGKIFLYAIKLCKRFSKLAFASAVEVGSSASSVKYRVTAKANTVADVYTASFSMTGSMQAFDANTVEIQNVTV